MGNIQSLFCILKGSSQSVEEDEEEEEEFDWQVEQEVYKESSEEELGAQQKYGFANQRSGVFARLQVKSCIRIWSRLYQLSVRNECQIECVFVVTDRQNSVMWLILKTQKVQQQLRGNGQGRRPRSLHFQHTTICKSWKKPYTLLKFVYAAVFSWNLLANQYPCVTAALICSRMMTLRDCWSLDPGGQNWVLHKIWREKLVSLPNPSVTF